MDFIFTIWLKNGHSFSSLLLTWLFSWSWN